MILDLNTISVNWNPTEILVAHIGSEQLEFSKNVGNQLILCARMNTWDQFYAMLDKKIPESHRQTMNDLVSGADKPTRWKLKESFARLTTSE